MFIAILLAHRPPRRSAGLVMLGCAALFGIAAIAFGLSLGALDLAGAADMTVFIRLTLVLSSTPDDMRGRVAA